MNRVDIILIRTPSQAQAVVSGLGNTRKLMEAIDKGWNMPQHPRKK